MRSCLILGCGRSGTSLAAGLFAGAGYYQGSDLLPVDAANPKGYFEDQEINAINETLIAQHLRSGTLRSLSDRVRNRKIGEGLRWLVALSGPVSERHGETLRDRIKVQLKNGPFLFKDPRFSYTFPAWQPYLPKDCCYIVVFRDPIRTAESIVKRAIERGYAKNVGLNLRMALRIWASAYQVILNSRIAAADSVFASYDSLLSASGQGAIGQLLGVQPDPKFADVAVSRSNTGKDVECVPTRLRRLFAQLREVERKTLGPLTDLHGTSSE